MPILETQSEFSQSLKGLHLFHYALSSCSQRVRLSLEEKGLDWESHHIDLPAQEHATAWYQQINPAGLVPALVHDGRVITESLDILLYLETQFQGVPLAAAEGQTRQLEDKLLKQADGLQDALKLLTHEFLLKPKQRMSPKQVADFASRHQNIELIAFNREFSNGFAAPRIEQDVRRMQKALSEIEQGLSASGNQWLLGSKLSNADISWVIIAYRLFLMRWDFASTPNVKRWLDSYTNKPTFKAAITDHEEKRIRRLMAIYSRYRAITGSGIAKYQRRVA